MASDLTDAMIAKVEASGGQDKRQVLQIVASDLRLEKWALRKEIKVALERGRGELQGRTRIKVFETGLPWWKHNRHLTLAYSEVADRGLLGGIYFSRRTKASRVSPVYVSHRSDCCELLSIFLAYLLRTKGQGGGAYGRIKERATEVAARVIESNKRREEDMTRRLVTLRNRLLDLPTEQPEGLDSRRVHGTVGGQPTE